MAEDVFHYAIARELLREAASATLAKAARRHGLAANGNANELAARIFTAYRAERFPERTVCEVMTWCFAGWSLDDLRALSDQALAFAELDARVNHALLPVFEWSRRSGIRIVIVSASPRFIVERAAQRWNVSPHDIAASTPTSSRGACCRGCSARCPMPRPK